MNRNMTLALAISALLASGCAVAPDRPVGAAEARAKLTRLQSDPALAGLAPASLKVA